MGDNGFREFFNAETGPFSVFNPNASSQKDAGTQARSVTEPVKDDASELNDCERCKDTRLVTIFNFDGNGSDADDQPCPNCRA